MKSMFGVVKYYAILMSGLTTVSWLIWARFIRSRVIRNIPDDLFTELRFWILFYICYIYLYIIRNLIKSKEPNAFIQELFALFFIPLNTLDHFIKYKSLIRNYYKKVNVIFINFLSDRTTTQVKILVIIFEIVPRVILVVFLLLDTFYFKKLELFYKIVLIGIFPFIFNYMYHCLEDLKTHFTSLLENKYSYVKIYEKGYEWEVTRERQNDTETEAEYHNKRVSLGEYIKIIIENTRKNNHVEDFPYEYVGFLIAKEETRKQYRKEKYNSDDVKLDSKNYDEIYKLFHYLIP